MRDFVCLMRRANEIIDPAEHYHLVERISAGVSGAGSVTAVLSGAAGMSAEAHEFVWMLGVACGIITGFGGLAVNWYYKHKEFQYNERKRKRSQKP